MKKIIGLNLKMNLNHDEVLDYVRVIKDKKFNNHELIIFPSFIYLDKFKESNQLLGTQNVHQEDEGAFTGEVSPLQLKSEEIDYSLVGHSERRKYFNEDDYLINKKIKGCLRNGLQVILCIGETEEQRNLNKTKEVLEKQIKEDLKDIDNGLIKNIVIAYEPVWAIGTGKTPTNQEIDEAIKYIKQCVKLNYGSNIRVIYGGSVNKGNIVDIMNISSVDGALIGSASNNPNNVLSMMDMID